jgi:hypothetical protein
VCAGDGRVPLVPDNRPPNQNRHGPGKSRGTADEVLDGLNDSLDASHKRLRFALAVQTRRIELAAAEGGLTTMQIDQLQQLSNSWRVLVANAPAPDLDDIPTDKLEAQLAAVKARASEK